MYYAIYILYMPCHMQYISYICIMQYISYKCFVICNICPIHVTFFKNITYIYLISLYIYHWLIFHKCNRTRPSPVSPEQLQSRRARETARPLGFNQQSYSRIHKDGLCRHCLTMV